jgi:hypothetical protein
MYNVLGTDNHDRETVSEYFYMTDLEQEHAQRICDHLNTDLGDGPGTYFRVVPFGHNLYIFEY